MLIETRLAFFLVLFIALAAPAQKVNNNWVFGEHGGLTFNTDPPTSISPTGVKPDTVPYFVSAISNRNGDLLFYTDGIDIWNRNHDYIVPDNWRWPWNYYTMPLICPYPGNDSLYYVFGIASGGSNAGNLVYATLNARANFGLGAVYYPPNGPDYVRLQQTAVPLLAGTAHCNQKDTWIINYTGGTFYAYLVTSAGVASGAVTSSFGNAVIPAAFNPGWSNIKISANGERLAVPLPYNKAVVVFDFNTATGVLSNPLKLSLPPEKTLDDAELSPDGSKLYLGAHEKTDPGLEQYNVYQMDLTAGSPAKIEASLYRINDRPDRGGCTPHDCFTIYRSLQLAPDGKIYVSMREVGSKDRDLTLSVIENPNKLAPEAFYVHNGVSVDAKYRILNYNYIRSGSFTLRENGISVKARTCRDQPVQFSLLISRADSVRWDFGDPASGGSNTSTQAAPTHLYARAGVYNVTAYVYTRCVVDTARKQFLLQDVNAVHIPAAIKDTVLCRGDQLKVDVSQPAALNYVWENNMTNPQRLIEDTGLYSLRISNECSFDYKRFHVDFVNCKCVAFVPTAFTPNRDGLNERFKPAFQCPTRNYTFKVIDRWGGVAFQSNRPAEGWDGKIKNVDAVMGVYAWLLQYTDPNTSQVVVKKGTVTLIR